MIIQVVIRFALGALHRPGGSRGVFIRSTVIVNDEPTLFSREVAFIHTGKAVSNQEGKEIGAASIAEISEVLESLDIGFLAVRCVVAQPVDAFEQIQALSVLGVVGEEFFVGGILSSVEICFAFVASVNEAVLVGVIFFVEESGHLEIDHLQREAVGRGRN